MEPRIGRVVNGAIVLEDAGGLAEGDQVTVWVRDGRDFVDLTDEELALVERGRASAADERLLDARTFLAELGREG